MYRDGDLLKKRKRRRKGHYKRGLHESVKGGQCKYRSGWELKYIEHLDASPDVKSFMYEGVSIEYVSNVRSGKVRRYIPDFLVEYVDGSKRLVEIKPSKRLVQATIQKKLRAARAWCETHGVTLEVITEFELRALRLL